MNPTPSLTDQSWSVGNLRPEQRNTSSGRTFPHAGDVQSVIYSGEFYASEYRSASSWDPAFNGLVFSHYEDDQPVFKEPHSR